MDYFLALDGIGGSSKISGHENWLEIPSLRFSISTDALGRPVLEGMDLEVLTNLANLLSSVTSQTPFAGASLHGVNAAGDILLSIDLRNVVITQVQDDASPVLSISLGFDAIDMATLRQDATGRALGVDPAFGWDSTTNQATTVPGTTPSAPPGLGGGGRDLFLLIDGLDGGSTDTNHLGWFEVDDFNLKADGTGFEDLSITFASRSGLTAFLEAVSTGAGFAGLRLEAVAPGAPPRLGERWDLVGATMTGLSTGDGPITASFSFSGIQIETFEQVSNLSTVDQFGITAPLPEIAVGTESSAATAAAEYFLCIEGLVGDATEVNHVGWFKLTGFDLDVAALASGKAEFSLLDVNFLTDTGFAQVLGAAVTGSTFLRASIQGTASVNGVATVVYDLSLGTVGISALTDSGTAPLSARLSFQAVELETRGLTAQGSLTAASSFGWSLATNSPTTVQTATPGSVDRGGSADHDYFLLIDGLNGGATEAGHVGWFKLSDFDIDIAHLAQLAADDPAGAVSFAKIMVDIVGQTAMAQLMQKATLAGKLAGMRIEGASNGPTPETTFRLDLGGVRIDSLAQTTTENGSSPRLGLSFDSFVLTQTDAISGVSTKAGYDLVTGTVTTATPTLTVGAANGAALTTRDGFLAIAGLGGGSQNSSHLNWFEVVEASFGMHLQAGKPIYDSFSVTLVKQFDLADLMAAAASGAAFSGATFQGLGLGNRLTEQLDLSAVTLNSLRFEVVNGETVVKLDFGFRALEVNSFTYDATGSLSGSTRFGWNTVTNTAATVGSATPGAGTVGDLGPSYMLIDGLNGTNLQDGHSGWFAVQNLSFEAARANATTFGNLSVTVTGEPAITAILTRLSAGAVLTGVTLDGVGDAGNLVTQTGLGGVRVVSVTTVAGDGELPSYVLVLAYDRITLSSFDAGGNKVGSFGWNNVTDVAFAGDIVTNPGGTIADDALNGTRFGNLLVGLQGDDRLMGEGGNDTLRGGTGRDRLEGGADTDTADFSDKTTSVVVALNGSTTVTATVGGVAEDTLKDIENVTGGSGADRLTGDGLNNVLIGGLGNDTLRGGLGADLMDGGSQIDTADYADQTLSVALVLNGATQATAAIGGLAQDMIQNIENVIGGTGNDTLTGDGLANNLQGGGGNDSLSGMDGKDLLQGGKGNDLIDGGASIDTADYSDHTTAVAVTLNGAALVTQTANGVAEDQLRNVENLIGGSGADLLRGDGLANTFRGGLGADRLEGAAGDDTLSGEGDNDSFSGGSGRDRMDGGTGFDTADYSDRTDVLAVTLAGAVAATVLMGGVSEDQLLNIEAVLGGSGADTMTGDLLANLLVGNAGADSLSGGDGNDTVKGGTGADILDGGLAFDTLDLTDKTSAIVVTLNGTVQVGVAVGGVGEDLVRGFEAVLGGSAADRITGDTLGNFLSGNGGADSLVGLNGDDTLRGGDGVDTLDGGLNSDTADFGDKTATVAVTLNGAVSVTAKVGGVLEDVLRGIENLTGGSGNDSLTGDSLVNVLIGGAGNDLLRGGLSKDTLSGGTGIDTADYTDKTTSVVVTLDGGLFAGVSVGGVSEDLIREIENVTGGTGNDSLTGDGLANCLLGGDGNDRIIGGAGKDSLDGGLGLDTADYSALTASVAVTLNGVVHASVAIGGVAEDLIRNFETVVGGAGNDSLTGDGLANRLEGGAGNDLLRGGIGADTLEGGAGADMADYAEKTTSVRVTLAVATSVSVTVGGLAEDTIQNIENLRGGSGADSLTGDTLANLLLGGDGSDTLTGAAGNDTVQGGLGLDTLDGGTNTDTLDYSDKTTEVVALLNGSTFFAVTVGGVIEDQIRNFENLIGGSGNDRLVGDGQANLIEAGAGNDKMQGLGGADTFDGGTGADLVSFSDKTLAVSVTLAGSAFADVSVGGTVEDRLRNVEDLTGGAGNDSLTGDALANLLEGGSGNDLLTGRGGIDTLDGNTGSDTASFNDKTAAVVVTLNGAVTVVATVGGVADDSLRNIENLVGGSGNDSLTGDGANNLLAGGSGNDTLEGGSGNDTLEGGAGRDQLSGGSGRDVADFSFGAGFDLVLTLNGANGATAVMDGVQGDELFDIEGVIGTGGADSITGDSLGNMLDGSSGNDTLSGGQGLDTLIGSTGADVFVFASTPNDLTNFDVISDFTSGTDKIELDFTNFSAIKAENFVLGTSANAVREQVIYDITTGKLFYDADGTGGGAQVLVAVLSTRPGLDLGDFV
ncbi:M10 family metallopeptidase C-terminal domain-containing protein [Stagnihabitans tardus]|uniref:Peptidase M10 serralysin C-terminal domain-containing protein n=1 Tax=Stagnihabitans tardus TaxID=2699202 RepID=A0AAE4YEJ3_9RHOB|nr:hypothetical protein [Stagnihabitans tardus]NBZ89921.1 hypothetical protein [Stagnihabitans tardus]